MSPSRSIKRENGNPIAWKCWTTASVLAIQIG